MKLSYLVNFIEEISVAIDTGKYNDIPVEVIAEQVEHLEVIPFLRKRLGTDFLFRPPEGIEEDLHRELLDIQNVITHPKNNGLCHLIILTADIILQRYKD
jgi:hypothetical protein